MKEDLALSYEILKWLNQQHFPMAIAFWNVEQRFKGVTMDVLTYHLYLLSEYGFIHGDIELISESDGPRISIGVIAGLSTKGLRFLQNGNSDRREAARLNLVNNDQEPSTNSVAEEVDTICRYMSNSRQMDIIVNAVIDELEARKAG